MSNQSRLDEAALWVLSFYKRDRRPLWSIFTVAIFIALVALVDYAVLPNYSLGLLYCLPLMLTAVSFDLKGLLLVALVITYLRNLFAPDVCPHAIVSHPYTPPHLCSAYLWGMVLRFMMYGAVGLVTHALAALYFRERELAGRNEALAQEVARAQHLAGIGQGVACIVHEIKNPLYAVAGAADYIHSLAARCAPEDARHAQAWHEVEEWAAITRSEVARLDELAHLILDYAQGKVLSLSRQPTTLGNALAEMKPLMQAAAGQANVSLLWEALPTPLVSVDARRMQQVALNLFNNALRATPAGRKVAVKIFHDTVNQRVCLSVSDEGCGIPESVRPRLFEPFTSNEDATGVGLGLAIVKQIVEAHQGQVQVISPEEGGTTFTVALPVGEAVETQRNGTLKAAADKSRTVF